MSSQGPFSSSAGAEFLKAWVDQAGALAPLLAPWKSFVEGMGIGGGFDPAKIFPGAPALGVTREYQEVAARLLDLSKQFQQRYAEFAQQNAAVMQDAFQVLKRRVDAGSPAAKSAADLYDAWIDCAEDSYAQAAHSDAFARLLAELCNISSAFKVERAKLTEQIARHLDLPSRSEIDTLHRQVRALKNALRDAAPNSNAGAARPSPAKAARAPRDPQKIRKPVKPRKPRKK